MRALEPTRTGYATNPDDGVRSYFEIFGREDAPRTILFLPTWSLIHSRCWKMQVPYFARRGFRVVTFDGRGNGLSDRPERGYRAADFAVDAMAVMDAAAVERAALVALSAGGRWATPIAARYPERASHVVLIGPAMSLLGASALAMEAFLGVPPDRQGWNKYNAVHWREDYADFVAWFAGQIFSEPHSTQGIDDVVRWAADGAPEMLIRTVVESATPDMAALWPTVGCPVLIIHGSDDHIIALDNSRELMATLPRAELVVIEGGGHAPNVREPVRTNLLIREFIDRHPAVIERRGIGHAGA